MGGFEYVERHGITDDAFPSLVGIRSLNMAWCLQRTITDAAFLSLVGIHTLDISGCTQRTITDAAFLSLTGIHTLNMSGCIQSSITDGAFLSLVGIHTLYMSGCTQRTITDAAFHSLVGIHTLYMCGCNQITDAAFKLFGWNSHIVHECPPSSRTRRSACSWGSILCTRLGAIISRGRWGVSVLLVFTLQTVLLDYWDLRAVHQDYAASGLIVSFPDVRIRFPLLEQLSNETLSLPTIGLLYGYPVAETLRTLGLGVVDST